MMSEHTPGPWIARKDPNAISPDDWCVGTSDQHIDKVAVCSECDARLIAAAPDLLEALRMAQTIIGHPDDPASQHIAHVISKATGA